MVRFDLSRGWTQADRRWWHRHGS